MDIVTGYYGVDWLAMTMTFSSLYLLGQKSRIGFVFGILANISWFTFGIMAHSIANSIANVIFVFLNIRGYRRWRKS